MFTQENLGNTSISKFRLFDTGGEISDERMMNVTEKQGDRFVTKKNK